jgi:hypothetical protein
MWIVLLLQKGEKNNGTPSKEDEAVDRYAGRTYVAENFIAVIIMYGATGRDPFMTNRDK